MTRQKPKELSEQSVRGSTREDLQCADFSDINDFSSEHNRLFQEFSDETRLQTILILQHFGEQFVGELCGKIDISQPALSHHLALSKMSGVLDYRREGKNNFYAISRRPTKNVATALDALAVMFEKWQKENDRDESIVPESKGFAREFSGLFAQVADITRLKTILLLNSQGEIDVKTLCGHLGMTQPGMSHHLGLLRLSGLIEPQRRGKQNFYDIARRLAFNPTIFLENLMLLYKQWKKENAIAARK